MSHNDDKQAPPPGMRDPARRNLSNHTFKDYLTVEKYSCETNGEYTRFSGGVRVGGGNPLHYHTSYKETFIPSEGELGLEIGGIITVLKVGEEATVPIGVVHRFFNPSPDKECKFAVEIRPGHEGFEKFLYIAYGMANDGLCDEDGIAKDKSVMALLSDLGDIRLAGTWAALMNPIIKRIAAYKRWRGAEEELLLRYWY
jgi:mannose-6-phosphate isomerase-like protein (cupin superfamily)